MIKTINEKIGYEQIIINSELAYPYLGAVSKVGKSKYENVTNKHKLYVNVKYPFKTTNHCIGSAKFVLYYTNLTSDKKVSLRVRAIDDLSEISSQTLMNDISNFDDSRLVESIVTLEKTNTSLFKTCVLDITNLIKNTTFVTNEIIFAVEILADDDVTFDLYHPDNVNIHVNENKKDEEDKYVSYATCFIYYSDLREISNEYRYNSFDVNYLATGGININTGKLNFAIPCFQTNNEKLPLGFSVFYDLERSKSFSPLGAKYVASFQYEIEYKTQTIYLTMPDGTQKGFEVLNIEDPIVNQYGIKHIPDDAQVVYLCQYDGSYLFMENSGTTNTLSIYDKNDTCIILEYDISSKKTKIKSVTLKNEDSIVYTWSGDYLEKIENSMGEVATFDYNSSTKMITSVDFYTSSRVIDFVYDTNNNLTQIKILRYNGTYRSQSSAEYLENTINFIYYENTKTTLKSISNTKTTANIEFGYINLVPISLTVFDPYTNKEYVTQNGKTKEYAYIINSEGQTIKYFYDYYGRCILEMDEQGKTVTYDYAQLQYGPVKRVQRQQKVIDNKINYIQNHSFEYDLDVHNEWQITLDEQQLGKVTLDNDSLYGKRCLKISPNGTAMVSQQMLIDKAGSYILKGYLKRLQSPSDTTNAVVELIANYMLNGENKEETVSLTISEETHNTQKWFEFTLPTLTIPEGSTNITFELRIVALTPILLDELYFSEQNKKTLTNIVKNSNFKQIDNNQLVGWNFSNQSDNFYTATDEYMSNINERYATIKSTYQVANAGNLRFARMFQNINLKGTSNQKFTLSMLVKGDPCLNNNSRSYVIFYYDGLDYETYYFDIDSSTDQWQNLVRKVTNYHPFEQIAVGIEYNGFHDLKIANIQLIKDMDGVEYSYDTLGNLNRLNNSSDNSVEIFYDAKNLKKEVITIDGNSYLYEYDEKQRVKTISDSYGNVVDFTYDDSNNLIQKTLTTFNNETFTQQYEYDSFRNVTKIIDEFGGITTKFFENGKLLNETYPSGDEYTYTYNHDRQVTNVSTSTGTSTYVNTLEYDSLGNTTKICNNENVTYDFIYNEDNELTQENYNNTPVIYHEFVESGTGQGKTTTYTKQYGNNTLNTNLVTYDNLERPKTVRLSNTLTNYQYDNQKQLIKASIQEMGNSNITNKYYSYDANGNLIKYTTDDNKQIKYNYDAKNNVQTKYYDINGEKYSIDYNYDYEDADFTKHAYFRRLYAADCDDFVKGGHKGYGLYGLEPTLTLQEEIEDSLNMEVLKFKNTSDILSYNLTTVNQKRSDGYFYDKYFNKQEWEEKFKTSKNVYFWIKFDGTSTSEIQLLSFMSNLEFLGGVCLMSDDTLAFKGTTGVIKYQTENTINRGCWNLICVKIEKLVSSYRCTLVLNDRCYNFVVDTSPEDINTITFNNNDSGTSIDLTSPYSICCISIGVGDLYEQEDYKNIYDDGLRYLTVDSQTKTTSVLYKKIPSNNQYDEISLTGHFVSKAGIQPTDLVTYNFSRYTDKTNFFEFDTTKNKYVYKVLNCKSSLFDRTKPLLGYNLSLQNQGFISLEFKIKEYNVTSSTIMANIKNYSTNIQVYHQYDSTNNCINVYVKYKYDTPVLIGTVSLNTWNKLYISFSNTTLTAYLNGNITTIPTNSVIDLTDTTTYFGAVSSSSYTLNGYLCNIKYGNTLPETNVLFDLDYDFKVSSQVDSIGRVKAKTITTSNTQLTSDYSYYKTRVTSQTLPNNQTITYSYDPNTGNIIQEYFYENNERVGLVEYDYDEHGRLIYERRNTDEYTYEYDENGNITQVLNPEDDSVIQSFTYRSDNKNLILTSASATNTYQFGYTGNDITSITKNGTTSILEWKGKQLVKYGENEFKYDENGLRIQKKASTTTLDYVYEGDKLIQETRRLTSTGDVIYTFNFIYDTNGELVAVEENGELYFYIRDITGNIIKIVDSSGNDMVRYTYDAWGKLIQKNTIEYNTVTQANPFLYKGYYYDVETQLFYCNSRYYSPELCRFISPDSIEYLDPQSINGLNLYCYCMNNPIMYADPSGHMPEWLQDTLKVFGAVGIVVGVTALTVLTAGVAAYALGASAAMIGAITTGAAIGGLVAGGLEIGVQICENGIDGMNLGAIAIESFAGSAYGAISGVASTTTSAALRLGMRGARVALGGLSTALHGINNGDSFGTIMLNVGVSIGTGILIQGAFAGLDAYTGKLSSAVLQNYALDGALNFGTNQLLLMSGILVGKNIWRNRGLFI